MIKILVFEESEELRSAVEKEIVDWAVDFYGWLDRTTRHNSNR